VTPEFQYNFEWSQTKATANVRKHGVSFEQAATVFREVATPPSTGSSLPIEYEDRSQTVPEQTPMKNEYDFSNGERERFYRLNAKLHLLVYLEPQIEARLASAARKRGEDLGSLVNRLLKRRSNWPKRYADEYTRSHEQVGQ
jgi:hypothetical protein